MPIKIVMENNGSCPCVFCDHCGERIVGAEDGNYEWRWQDEGQGAELFFTHKLCCEPFEASRGGSSEWCAEELRDLPIRLAANLGMPIDVRQTDGGLISYVLQGSLINL